jgi:hypothetical protein
MLHAVQLEALKIMAAAASNTAGWLAEQEGGGCWGLQEGWAACCMFCAGKECRHVDGDEQQIGQEWAVNQSAGQMGCML